MSGFKGERTFKAFYGSLSAHRISARHILPEKSYIRTFTHDMAFNLLHLKTRRIHKRGAQAYDAACREAQRFTREIKPLIVITWQTNSP